MRLFLSERDLSRRQWRHFGRPLVTLVGVAALIGLVIGVLWVVAGILHFHPLW
jgi:hypothetical protein